MKSNKLPSPIIPSIAIKFNSSESKLKASVSLFRGVLSIAGAIIAAAAGVGAEVALFFFFFFFGFVIFFVFFFLDEATESEDFSYYLTLVYQEWSRTFLPSLW